MTAKEATELSNSNDIDTRYSAVFDKVEDAARLGMKYIYIAEHELPRDFKKILTKEPYLYKVSDGTVKFTGNGYEVSSYMISWD